ncbi:hypothetical protein CLU79DRAFT_887759 [Phycomyces nitens]|nr:hypothetical protein CLU79DRAFT_887759 [Phycomyces nitens]
MSSIEPLATAIVNYSRVLKEASTSRVAFWNPSFLERCSEWCLFIETELMLYSKDLREKCHDLASKKTDSIPSLLVLLDAQHQLYKTLLVNEYVDDDLYMFITKTYNFSSTTDHSPDMLTEDLSNLAQTAATLEVLCKMQNILDQ